MNNSSTANGGALLGRILLALIFILSGWNKIGGYAGTAEHMAKVGLPGALLPLVIALELAGGLLIVIGWQTRIAAVALAVFCVAAAVLFHANLADRNQLLHFEKDLAIAGGLLVLGVAGAGRWSIERGA